MIKKWFLLTLVTAIILVNGFSVLAEDQEATPTVTATPPTPTVETTPSPSPMTTEKDIPVSESNPSWLLEQERQFYAKTVVVPSAAPAPTPTRYYRYIQTTPTPSPTPLITKNTTQVKGMSSAIAYKEPGKQKTDQHSLAFLAMISIIVSLAAVVLSRILKPKTIR